MSRLSEVDLGENDVDLDMRNHRIFNDINRSRILESRLLVLSAVVEEGNRCVEVGRRRGQATSGSHLYLARVKTPYFSQCRLSD